MCQAHIVRIGSVKRRLNADQKLTAGVEHSSEDDNQHSKYKKKDKVFDEDRCTRLFLKLIQLICYHVADIRATVLVYEHF